MLHVDTLIGEELRLIPKGKWDSISMPMLVPRRAEFRNKPEYFERTDLDEPTRVWTITSNRTKNELRLVKVVTIILYFTKNSSRI